MRGHASKTNRSATSVGSAGTLLYVMRICQQRRNIMFAVGYAPVLLSRKSSSPWMSTSHSLWPKYFPINSTHSKLNVFGSSGISGASTNNAQRQRWRQAALRRGPEGHHGQTQRSAWWLDRGAPEPGRPKMDPSAPKFLSTRTWKSLPK